MQFPDAAVPIRHELVLIGGGHAHLAVIRAFGMNPIPGVQVTVVSRDTHTPYSGMLPGLIAGHYRFDDSHIDLRPLCEESGIRLIRASVVGIDYQQRRIRLSDRPPLHYTWLSVNTGSTPALAAIDGAEQFGIAVKPVDRFLQRWSEFERLFLANPTPTELAIVGGGAAGVEVALACEHRIRSASSDARERLTIRLITASEQVPAGHNARVQQRVRRTLAERKIELISGVRVTRAREQDLTLSDGRVLPYQQLIWCLPGAAPDWLAHSGLACDDRGFLLVDHTLCSLTDNRVFAAGDIASLPSPVPKSGVYAVRAGQILATNLRHVVLDRPLRRYRPQTRFLSLISTGDRSAIASKGIGSAQGQWVWNWKDRIDQQFMSMYRAHPIVPNTHAAEVTLRCGGCAAKVPADTLSAVMSALRPHLRDDIRSAIDHPDDAAMVTLTADTRMLQSVDYFRAFIDDPYLLGKIASVHCLSDIVAMGATPHSALAIATLPHASPTITEHALEQLMAGALATLNSEQITLAGGHTNEGAELAFGLSVTGFCRAGELLAKGGLRAGQLLILTKALGSGTLFAANMAAAARGSWIDEALERMQQSPMQAMQLLREHGATACTDITGFGLVGHLLEMLRAAELRAEIDTRCLPIMTGAMECLRAGYTSSLNPANQQHLSACQWRSAEARHRAEMAALLVDPQTAGGLLSGIPPANAAACLEALKNAGYIDAAVIGVVCERDQTNAEWVSLS